MLPYINRSFEFDCDTFGCLNSSESFQMFSAYDFYSEIVRLYITKNQIKSCSICGFTDKMVLI